MDETVVVCFSHGMLSGPWGTKIRTLAAVASHCGATADSVDYQGVMDPEERVAMLLNHCRGYTGPVVLVGSSMGGYVATRVAQEVDPLGLFVLAPAFGMPTYPAIKGWPTCPTAIVHGYGDEVIPVDNSIAVAKDTRATLHLVDGDHRLIENLPTIAVWFEQFVRGLTA